MLEVGNGSKGKVLVDECLHNWVAFAEGDVHLHGALAVTDVVDFLGGDFIDVGEEGRQIVVGHVLEGEFPKLFVFVRVVLGVVTGVFVSAVVAQPDIVSSVSEHESWSFVFFVDEPSVGTICKSMLEQYGFESFSYG